MTDKKTSNYDYFIKADTRAYKGQWVAIAGQKIIAHGKDAQIVYKHAQKLAGTKHISLAKAPDEQMLVLKFFS